MTAEQRICWLKRQETRREQNKNIPTVENPYKEAGVTGLSPPVESKDLTDIDRALGLDEEGELVDFEQPMFQGYMDEDAALEAAIKASLLDAKPTQISQSTGPHP